VQVLLDDGTFLHCNYNEFIDVNEVVSLQCGPYSLPKEGNNAKKYTLEEYQKLRGEMIKK